MFRRNVFYEILNYILKMMSGFKKMPKEKAEGSEGNRVKRVELVPFRDICR